MRLKADKLEIYPAIIFPSGATIVETSNDTVTTRNIEVWAIKNGWQKIETRKFMGTIPHWYFGAISQTHFGLKKFNKKVNLPLINQKLIWKNTYNDASVSESKDWIKERLAILGYKKDSFAIKHFTIKYSISQKKIINKELIKEKLYGLH
ncbi:hypothetical protein [uncultured Psychroserpens sp.]|uniref:hypothetical protein n=1 Tax=uncultured Psychroserpens sp. TaxID=255436 RepID=UPI0026127204|nr:hypothetical protein [uncultured Psychroserpens sp.]